MSPATPAQVLPAPGRIDEPRFGLTPALAVALLLHLLLLLLVSAFPGIFAAPRTSLLVIDEPERPPLRFTFMDLVDDRVVPDNPDAELISDKSREEAGETPRVTTPEGKEPPSSGNTPERIDGGAPPVPLPPVEPAEVRLPRPAPESPARSPAQPPSPPAAADAGDEPRETAESASPPAGAASERATGMPQGREATPRDGAGGDETASDRARPRGAGREARQERFSRALQDLSLPTDLQAISPPDPAEPGSPDAGRATIWQFDNANPNYPVNIGSLSFDSKGAEFGPWLAEFHRRVLNEWHRNLEAWSLEVWRNISASQFISDQEKVMRHQYQMANVRGVTGVDFVVTREGSVVQLDIVHRSGHEGLDRSVQRTLRNVLLPPLPDDFPDEQLPIRAGFYYNVRPPD